jgi:CHAT domain-containing protein/Tfp pilus assembly protein PilF
MRVSFPLFRSRDCLAILPVLSFLAWLFVPLGPIRAAEPAPVESWIQLAAEQDRLNDELVRLTRAEKYDAAVPLAEKLVATARRLIAAKPPDAKGAKAVLRAQEVVVAALGWLVSQHIRREDWAAAIRAQQEMVGFHEQVWGKGDYRTADARREVAYLQLVGRLPLNDARQLTKAEQLESESVEFRNRGKIPEALPLAEETLRIRKRLLGDADARIAKTLHLLAELHEFQRDYVGAEPLYRQTSDLQKRVLGEEHPLYATTLHNLAVMYAKHADYRRAEPLFREALEIRKKVLGANHPVHVQSLSALANLYYVQKDYARTEPLLRQALEIRKKVLGENHPEYAENLHNLAVVYGEQGDYARAEPLLLQALEIRKKVPGDNRVDYVQSLNNLAVHYKQRSQYARAEPLFRQVLEIRKKVLGENHPDYARSLRNLANLYCDQGDYARAEPLHRQAMEIFRNVLGENHPDYAIGLNNLALLYRCQGDYARAEPLFRQALEIHKKVSGENHPLYTTVLDNLAGLYKDQGDYTRAESLFCQALEIKKQSLGENDSSYALTLSDLAELYKHQGDYARAERMLRQALEITKKVLGKNHPDYGTALNNLALLYGNQGDYARAEPMLRQAVEIDKKLRGENHPNYAAGLNNLALLYQEQGDYARAEPLCRQALEIRKKALGENHPEYANSLNALGFIYKDQGDYAHAEPLYRQALEIRKRTLGENHPDYANSLNNLAGLYKVQGDYARTETLLRQALETFQRALGENNHDYATSLNNLAWVYAAQGDYARAEPRYRQALEIKKKVLGEDHPDYAASLHNLANLYFRQGDYARTEPLYRQALAIIRRHVEATAVVQSERQQLAMLQSARQYLDAYLMLAVRSGQFTEPAYREMLAWKGMVLRRQRLSRAAGESPELLVVFNRLQRVATQLSKLAWVTPDPKQEANWRQRVAQLSAEKERLEAELSSQSAAYRQAKHQATLEELQAALPQGVVLVDFLEYWHYTPPDKQAGTKWTGEQRMLAFVVGRDRPVEMVPLGAVAQISEAIDTWRTTFGMTPQGRAAGRRLRERIWEPVEAKLQGAKIVLVSPDGPLGRLPLGALPGKEPGKYLLEERTIALVPVPQLIPELVQEEGHKQLKKNLLLLGNVDYDAAPGKAAPSPPAPLPQAGEGSLEAAPKKSSRALAGTAVHFNPLAGTQDEIATIEKLYQYDFGSQGMAKLDRNQATKRAFLAEAPKHRYLHVATHGFFAPESQRSALTVTPEGPSRFGEMLDGSRGPQVTGLHPGLLSGLALTGANRAGTSAVADDPEADDGILTAEEIGTMNLDGVNLVMLSACETGLGQVAGGEGLLGLQRAFQSAGARSVVASLWKVDDAATRTLMVEFYKNRWEKKLSKLQALRQAQLKMMRDYDAKSGQLRGAGVVKPVDPAKLAAATETARKTAPSPFYWAAFVLSGDWR